jgi:hypothetical protein
MRTASLLLCLAACVCAFTVVAGSTAPIPISLGRCASYAAHAGTAVAANGVVTTIFTGSIGSAPGLAVTGNLGVVVGSIETNSEDAKGCAADELIAFGALKGALCPANQTLAAADMAGRTFTPGVYCSATGTLMITASTVTLDGQGNPDAQFIFQVSSRWRTHDGERKRVLPRRLIARVRTPSASSRIDCSRADFERLLAPLSWLLSA